MLVDFDEQEGRATTTFPAIQSGSIGPRRVKNAAVGCKLKANDFNYSKTGEIQQAQ